MILAFETSAKAASVAIMKDGILLGECYQNTGLTHSQTLMCMAESLMQQCNCTVEQIDAVAVAAGPGSFTGVRIGVAAAKGFAWSRRIPCYGTSTLESMALSLGIYEGTVCAVMDARRNQVYNALFKAENGVLTRLCEDRAISIEELKALLPDGPVFLVGDGSKLCKQHIPEAILAPEHRQHQRAAGVALAAEAMMARGESGDANALSPNYLRLSQAERERAEKMSK